MKVPFVTETATTSAMKRLYFSARSGSRSLHSRWPMHSSMRGAATFLALMGVRPNFLNLSTRLPDTLPAPITAFFNPAAGTLIANSPVFVMHSNE